VSADREARTEKLSRIRKVIATRMRDSLAGSAQLTSVVEVDLSNLMLLRRSHGATFRQLHGTALSPLSIIARGVCLLLARHSVLNARIDLAQGTATYFSAVNLGIAVDSDKGLLVPNLKDADRHTVAALAVGIQDLAERARSSRLRPEDMESGTFTITNTGSRGSLLDTPILNAPEVGILALGAVTRRPAVIKDEQGERLEARDLAYLCLTYDHRLVDGAQAACFLVDVKGWLETANLRDEVEAAA
jgi:pyruvate/2-oxoglutarate dehydrogenase complex dihydrolipoamide acyltransferase (E2) component